MTTKTAPRPKSKPVASKDIGAPAAIASSRDNSLLHEAGPVRLRRCRHGVMAYIVHDSYIGRSLDLYGEFSPGEAALFAQFLKPGMVALDVGANMGAHTVLFANRVGPRGRVIAFEPQRVIHQLLCANIMMNGYVNVEARMAAAGSTPGSLKVPPVNYGQAGNYGSLSLGGYQQGETVPVETIDSLNLPHCHFIKADVEGMESDVIRGAAETIKRCRPLLYVENDRREKSKELIELLFGLNYRLYWHLTPYYIANNYFGNAENVFPNTISINMLAVPKESPQRIEGAREVISADEDWKTILAPKPIRQ